MALQRRLHSAVYTEWCRSLGALPVPNAGQWLGSTPAGCEVCRGSPAENESPTLDRDLPKSALRPACKREEKALPTRSRPHMAQMRSARSPLFGRYDGKRRTRICEQQFVAAQSASGVTASEIYMRQSEPQCSRKSAVPGRIFRSLVSSNDAQPIDRAEV